MGLIYLGILVSYIALEMVIKFRPEPRVLSDPNCLSYFCLVFFFFDINLSFLGYRYRKTAVLFTGLLYLLCLFFIVTQYYEPKLNLAQHTDFYFIYGLILGYYWLLSPSEEMPIIINEESNEVEQDNALVELNKSEIPQTLYRFMRNLLFGNLITMFFMRYKSMNNYSISLSHFNYQKFLSDSFNDFSLFSSGYIITAILESYMTQKKDFIDENMTKGKRFTGIVKRYIAFAVIKLGFVLLINNEFNSTIHSMASKHIPQHHFLVLFNMVNFAIEKKSRLINTIILSFI